MMKKEPMPIAEASPYKSAAEGLATLRKTLRLACRSYLERVEMEIIRIHEQVVTAGMAAASGDARKPAGAPGARAKAAAANSRGPQGGGPSAASARSADLPNSEIHDLRDMLTLLRTLEVKPEAGRRKDLKKIETLVEDLRLLSERWG